MRAQKLVLTVLLVLAVATICAVPLCAATTHDKGALTLPFSALAGMAIAVKSVDAVTKKYVTRAQGAGADYSAGVSNPRRPWQSSTLAASQTYAQGVNDAIANGSFDKGVKKAGDDKWARKSTAVGAQRYGPGVTAAQSDYSSGVAPYLTTLANLTLPVRQPKGSPSNIARVQAVTEAMRAQKLKG